MRRASKPPVPKATMDTLRLVQDRQTIRMALSNGATATPIGAITHIRLPGQDRAQQFPTELVEDVQRAMRKAREDA